MEAKRRRKESKESPASSDDKKPRVRAQRKFASGQGQSPLLLRNSTQNQMKTCQPKADASAAPAPDKGECPKTEDFLTFLCLRGTNLLPPELDHFNEDVKLTEEKQAGVKSAGVCANVAGVGMAKKLANLPMAGAVKKSAANANLAKKNMSKALPESVRALQKKYAEKRLARCVVTQKRALRSSRREVRESSKKMISPNRKPSAAAIIARRKTRMATLTAAASSRMLTRLTPRGTSNQAFVKQTRAARFKNRGRRSLRGREIAVSSDDDRPPPDPHLPVKKKLQAKLAPQPPSDDDADIRTLSKDPAAKSKVPNMNDSSKKVSVDQSPAQTSTDSTAETAFAAANNKKKKKKKDEVVGDKKKAKESLKALQDRLLEEAKLKMNPTPPSDCAAHEAETVGGDADERITISQRTGYIQVKKPRLSNDQSRDETVGMGTTMDVPASAPASANGGLLQQPVSAIVGAGRRLSNGKNVERTATPPRKILPKKSDSMELMPSGGSLMPSANGAHTTCSSPHLPLGVMGAGALSSSPLSVKSTSSSTSAAPLSSIPAIISAGHGQAIPLTQPLMINTSFAGGNSAVMSNAPQTMAMSASGGPILMSNTSLRMAPAIPMQMRPILMPQIALPMHMPTTPTHLSTSVKPPPQQMMAVCVPVSAGVVSQPSNARSSSKSSTAVTFTTSTNQPLVSPGPPMLSPQVLQHQHSNGQRPISSSSSSSLSSFPAQLAQLPPPPPLAPLNAFPPPPPPPLLTPVSVTPGAVIRSVAPSKLSCKSNGALTIPNYPTSGPSARSAPRPFPSVQQLPPPRATYLANSTSVYPPLIRHPSFGLPTFKHKSNSFSVDSEASPYTFEVDEAQPQLRTAASQNKRSSHGIRKEPTMPDLGTSIDIPDELATRLAEQAAAESMPSGTETTYFIPLSTGPTGQSFGVAVKLGTEGPPGPNQKVIMKAKLVTQPLCKPIGATRLIGGLKSGNASPAASAMSPPSRLTMASPLSENSSGSSQSSDSEQEKAQTNVAKKRLKSTGTLPSTTVTEKQRKEAHISDSAKSKILEAACALPMSSTSYSSSPAPPQNASKCSSPSAVSSGVCCVGQIEATDQFPRSGQHARLVEAPIYRPTEKEFHDPIKYIEKIRREAEPFGICKIIPPASFKPECNVDDDMRFTAYNQYVHKMMNRWGPNSKEFAAIKKYLETQNVKIRPNNHPLVGGVEIDLPALYHAVQSFGGLTEVIQKKKWGKIADFLRIPKNTQDRGNKLDDIYCKFLLPYDTLSEVERGELLRLVEEEWEQKNQRKLKKLEAATDNASQGHSQGRKNSDDDEEDDEDQEDEEEDEFDECVLKGKSTSLAAFFRVARNLMSVVFKNHLPGEQPDLKEVEQEFWRIVMDKDIHVQVQQGSIDTGTGRGGEEFGFPTTRGSSCGRHPWNLKVLSNNFRSLLRCMGPVMGVTVPTLHVGMLFTAGCWYRDPHGLPWIEYHHTGVPKIWYAVPDSHGLEFYTAMRRLVPTVCRKKPIWLPSDSVMVPPNLLVKCGVSCCRSVQEQGQFIVIFPRAYTSNICTGYTVSESVYFASKEFLHIAEAEFKKIRDSREPMMFPLPKLLLCVAQDQKTKKHTLTLVKPLLEQMRDNEFVKRAMISDLGVKNSARINLKSSSKTQTEEDEYECEVCSANLYVSFLCDVKEDKYFCHDHALDYLQKLKMAQRRHCKLLFTHGKEEITSIIKMVNQRIQDSDEESSSSGSEDMVIRRVSELNTWTDQQQLRQSQVPKLEPHSNVTLSSLRMVQKEKKDSRPAKSYVSANTRSHSSSSSSYDEEDDDDSSSAQSSATDDEVLFSDSSSRNKKPKDKKAKPTATNSKGKKSAGPVAASKKETAPSSKKTAVNTRRKSSAAAAAKRGRGQSECEEAGAASSSSTNTSLPLTRRKTKVRKAALDKAGNLASEILDMLLSTSNESSDENEENEDSSDESWK